MAMAGNLVSIGRRERGYNMNVGSFNENKKHSDKARWICIYPAYLNSKKTISDGRKIPLKQAIENPTCNEIRDVLVAAGFKVEMEVGKVFPREMMKYETMNRGRLRVQLKNDDGTLVQSEYKDRDSIFSYAAQTIPKLKSRGAGAKSGSQTEAPVKTGSTSTKKRNKK